MKKNFFLTLFSVSIIFANANNLIKIPATSILKVDKISSEQLYLNTLLKIKNINDIVMVSNNYDISKLKIAKEKLLKLSTTLNEIELNKEICGILNLPKEFNLISEINQINENFKQLALVYGNDLNSKTSKKLIDTYLLKNNKMGFWCTAKCWAEASAMFIGLSTISGGIGTPAAFVISAVFEIGCIAECD